jgi:uncharacterized GH25 family protein
LLIASRILPATILQTGTASGTIVTMFTPLVFAVALGFATPAAAEHTNKSWVGRVVDEDGRPLAGAMVTAFEITCDGDNWQKSRKRELAALGTGADGRFQFGAKGMDKCAVVVATKAGKCSDASLPGLSSDEEMTLRLGPAAELEGLVMDDAGAPVAGVEVRILLSDAYALPKETRMTTTDRQGRFRVSDLPRSANFELDISAPGYARALAKGPFVPSQKGLRFVLPPEGRLEGIVVAKDTGKPLPNVRVTAMSGVPSGMHHAYAKTDQAGRFAMSGLSGGKYKIETIGEIVDNELTPPAWIGSIEKVEVEAGKFSSGVKLKAVRGGLLEIVLISSATGQPVKDGGVLIVSDEKDLRMARSEKNCNTGLFE